MILEYKKRNEVDMSHWDIDDDIGTLAHVVWPIDKSVGLTGMTIKIDCEINPWVEENIDGECFYTFELSKKAVKCQGMYDEIVFYFKKVEDAFLFKLTWG